MTDRGRVPLGWIAGVGLLLLCGVSAVAVWQRRVVIQLQGSLHAVQVGMNQLQADHEQLQTAYTSIQQERASLQERLSHLQQALTTTTAQLEEATHRWDATTAQLAELRTEKSDLQQVLTTTQQSLSTTQHQAEALQTKNHELLRAARSLKGRLLVLERDYTTLKQTAQAAVPVAPTVNVAAVPTPVPSSVELSPIVVNPSHPTAKVLEVNAAHQFVILDQGTQAGLAPGMRLALRRGEIPLGVLTVTRVRPMLSACDLLPPADPAHVAVGDEAIVVAEKL